MTTPTAIQITPATISSYTLAWLRHLNSGAPLYVPGSDSGSHSQCFLPTQPLHLYRHPYNRTQMPMLAGTFDTLLPEATAQTWLISIAHLAHANCPACAGTWTDADDCLDILTAGTTLFHTEPTPGHHLMMIHREDG
jgi:hypothetical protein